MNSNILKKGVVLLGILIGLYMGYRMFFAASVGKQAPDFETTLVDGSSFKLSELRGGYVLLDFWGSWCPPCRRENPKLAALHHRYKEQLTIVTVALEKTKNSWKRAAEKDGFVWKHQIVSQNSFVMLSEIARSYGVTAIPTKFLIDPQGNIVGKLSFEEIATLLDTVE